MIFDTQKAIVKSFSKINIGLNIQSRRSDGFHNISSLLVPLRGLFDIIELHKSDIFEFTSSGIEIECETEDNLAVRALRLMQREHGIGEAKIHLHKMVPMQAGLGGGSANATTVLTICNTLWNLGLDNNTLRSLAAKLGSDTPFFVEPRPQIASGRGEVLNSFNIPQLNGKWVIIITPPIEISTAKAYAGAKPHLASPTIEEALSMPIDKWHKVLHNDFENTLFEAFPILEEIKQNLYRQGAIYSSLSGSGSSIFGLFDIKPSCDQWSDYFVHVEQIGL